MKQKINCLLLIVILCSVFTACGCDSNNKINVDSSQTDVKQHTTKGEVSDIDNLVSSFQPPADIIDIDLNSQDPSNDKIKFEYDDKGRISKCYYKINDKDVFQSYTYKDNIVEIYTLCDNIVIGNDSFVYVYDNDSTGFYEKDGYYIKYPTLTTATSKPGESKATEINNDYSSYIGTWTTLPSAGVTVVFNSFDDNTAKFFIISNTADASHVATTENISAKVTNDNEIKFDYHDSWDNYGSGTISLNNDSIYLKLVPSKKNGSYGVYCDDKLLKTSDDVWENTFQ